MKHVAIVDIGSTTVKSALVSLTRDGEMQIAGQSVRKHDGFDAKTDELPAQSIKSATLATLDAAQEEARSDVDSVYIVVPGAMSRVICCRAEEYNDPPRLLRQEDITRMSDRSLEEVETEGLVRLHNMPVYYTFEGETYYTVPESKPVEALEIVFSHVFMEEKFSQLVEGIFKGSNYQVEQYIDGGYSQALYLISKEALERDAILVDIGGKTADITVMRSQAPIFRKSLTIGGDRITSDLQIVTGMSEEAAEKIKKRYVFGLAYDEGGESVRMEAGETEVVSNRLLQDVIEARASEMVTMIGACISEAPVDYMEGTGLMLTGGGMTPIRGSVEFFQKFVGFPVSSKLPRSCPPSAFALTSTLGLANFVLNEEDEDDDEPAEGGFFKKILHFFTE